MSRPTRREFLAATGGMIGAAGISGCLHLAGDSVNKKFTLDVAWKNAVLDGTPVRLRAYNDSVPGPQLEFDPGDTIEIVLRNSLTAYDSSAWTGDMNVPHMLDQTNLHLHGLEIVPHLFEPIGTSDPKASMIMVGPDDTYIYTFAIPSDQPPGLFWYHPHHHGSTAVQAVTGMAGAVIVRGAIDEVPAIKAAREILLAIQDIGLFPSDNEHDLWTYEPVQNAVWVTSEGKVRKGTWKNPKWVDLKGGFTTGDYALHFFLVNGEPFFKETHNYQTGTTTIDGKQRQNATIPHAFQLDSYPRYDVQPGEVVRFRVLNGCSENLMPIAIEGHDIYLLALDGVNFPAVRHIPAPAADMEAQVSLAPANRAEFMIRANSLAPGQSSATYQIVQCAQNLQYTYSAAKVIAEIVVSGDPVDMALPDALPIPTRHYPLIREDEIRKKRAVEFLGAYEGPDNPVIGLDFLINNELYDETGIDRRFNDCELGTAEKWTLQVGDHTHQGTEGHPFHIHTNSFEVISIGDVEQPPGTIMDTIWVGLGEPVVIRMKFREWTGKGVFHCHILPHEDTGMMKNFLIKAKWD